MDDCAYTFGYAWVRLTSTVAHMSTRSLHSAIGASLLFQQAETSQQKFAVEFQKLQQLNMDILMND